MAMVPHERSLVDRFRDKPFALLGVNADSSPEELRRVQETKQINWRSWSDGRRGPIASKFRVKGFPTLLLIDPHGIIRYTQLGKPRDSDLERAIGDLISEAEQELKRKTAARAFSDNDS